ncbi:MAG: T9SS type A sorting domain-containing protein [Flavobacteriales bacterium]|nr:T9SS type A sorting domain-containing protein [Flavobacteriales bacterium]
MTRAQGSLIILCFALATPCAAQTESEPNNSTATADQWDHATNMIGGIGICGQADFSVDHYVFTPPSAGRLKIRTAISATSPQPVNVELTLLNSAIEVVEAWTVTTGPIGTTVTDSIEVLCAGTGIYYLRLVGPGGPLCVNYSLFHEVTPPVFGADLEPNNVFGQADTLFPGVEQDGRLDFQYGDNVDLYRLLPPEDGMMRLTWSGENASVDEATATLTLSTLTNFIIDSWEVPVGSNGSPGPDVHQVACIGAGEAYVLRVETDICGTSYRFNYAIGPPVFANDIEPNNTFEQAIPVPSEDPAEGHINNFNGDNIDMYQVTMPADGVLEIAWEAEHVDTNSTATATLTLFNVDLEPVESWSVPVKGNSEPVARSVRSYCKGAGETYYLRVVSNICGASYRWSYAVLEPTFSGDAEPNNNNGEATLAEAGVDHEGYLGSLDTDLFDVYELVLEGDGTLSLMIGAEHADTTTNGMLTMTLYDQDLELAAQWLAPVGPSSIVNESTRTFPCAGAEEPYYLWISSNICGTSYRFNYSITPRFFGDDIEPNDELSDAVPLDLGAEAAEGRLGFFHDNAIDLYRAELANDGVISVDTRAENRGPASTMDLELLNASEEVIDQHDLPVGGSGSPQSGSFTSIILPAGIYYLRLANAPCGTSYILECTDDDDDGTCNGSDVCPGVPEPGTPCDDGIAGTIDDQWTTDCICSGEIATSVSDQGMPGDLVAWPNPNDGDVLFLNARVSGQVVNALGQATSTVVNSSVVWIKDLKPGMYTLITTERAVVRFVRR